MCVDGRCGHFTPRSRKDSKLNNLVGELVERHALRALEHLLEQAPEGDPGVRRFLALNEQLKGVMARQRPLFDRSAELLDRHEASQALREATNRDGLLRDEMQIALLAAITAANSPSPELRQRVLKGIADTTAAALANAPHYEAVLQAWAEEVEQAVAEPAEATA